VKSAHAISARGLGFSYGGERGTVLRSVNLSVEPGEIAIVTGASGAGKTTLLTLCAALRSMQEGQLRVLGRELKGISPAEQREMRSSIGLVFQSHSLIDALTAGQNVMMSLLGRLPAADANKRAEEALGLLGLGNRANALPEELSGGEKQRVAVARALVRRPELILADEPTASLDDVTVAAVKAAIAAAVRLSSCAVLLVTHDARIFGMADRMLRLADGALVEVSLRNHLPELARCKSTACA
jgi:putative ABC transport system ATP-binding protein